MTTSQSAASGILASHQRVLIAAEIAQRGLRISAEKTCQCRDLTNVKLRADHSVVDHVAGGDVRIAEQGKTLSKRRVGSIVLPVGEQSLRQQHV